MKNKQAVSEPDGNVAINETEVPVILKLAIPPDLYEQYKEISDAQQLTVAELMLDRLRRCVGHSSIRSLYFTESQLRQLEQILQKRPLSEPEHILSLLTSLLAVRIGDLPPIPISAQQARRLAMGVYGGKTLHEHITAIVTPAIIKATGV